MPGQDANDVTVTSLSQPGQRHVHRRRRRRAGRRCAIARASDSPTINTYIFNNATVNAGQNVTVQTLHNYNQAAASSTTRQGKAWRRRAP